MLKIRWLMLALGIGVLFPTILKGEIGYALIAFLCGMIYGLLIDLLGTKMIGLWQYTGQQKEYFIITVPCWGIFSMAVNLIWNWIEVPWLAFIAISIGLFLFLEVPNLKTRSWVYKVPVWLVVIGWIPLILSFRVLYVHIIRMFT